MAVRGGLVNGNHLLDGTYLISVYPEQFLQVFHGNVNVGRRKGNTTSLLQQSVGCMCGIHCSHKGLSKRGSIWCEMLGLWLCWGCSVLCDGAVLVGHSYTVGPPSYSTHLPTGGW